MSLPLGQQDNCNIRQILTPLKSYLRDPSNYDNDRKIRLIRDIDTILLPRMKDLSAITSINQLGSDVEYYRLNIIEAYNEYQKLQEQLSRLPEEDPIGQKLKQYETYCTKFYGLFNPGDTSKQGGRQRGKSRSRDTLRPSKSRTKSKRAKSKRGKSRAKSKRRH